MGFFPRNTRTSRNSRGKRAIGVQATEVLLYTKYHINPVKGSGDHASYESGTLLTAHHKE